MTTLRGGNQNPTSEQPSDAEHAGRRDLEGCPAGPRRGKRPALAIWATVGRWAHEERWRERRRKRHEPTSAEWSILWSGALEPVVFSCRRTLRLPGASLDSADTTQSGSRTDQRCGGSAPVATPNSAHRSSGSWGATGRFACRAAVRQARPSSSRRHPEGRALRSPSRASCTSAPCP